MSTPANIVFILTDDHAAHSISAYGSRVNQTPHLDRIAEQGVRMDAVYCTNSICSPSRATILTGTYSHINGVSSIWTEIDYRVPTFIDALHDNGYATALFGKWHLGESPESLPRSFDAWCVLPGQGDYVDPEMIDAEGTKVHTGYATDIITDMSIEWLEQRDPKTPFCLMVHHKAPHRPWIPDPKHKDLYPLGTIPEPPTFFDDNASRSQAVQRVRMTIADDLGSDDIKAEVPDELRGPQNRDARASWKYQRYMRDYLQCVQSVDDNTGRLLDYLDSHGLGDNTMVVYTSDQGFFLGDHGWFDKRLMFDQSLQMPMLIRWPAEIPAGSRCEAMITNADFAATFLDVCGLDADTVLPTGQGRSFRAVMRGDEVTDWPEAVYYRYWEHDDPIHRAPGHYGIRTKTHKLIRYYGAGLGVPGASDVVYPVEWELYDLAADPEEIRNVADDPAYADVRAALEQQLATIQARYADLPYAGPDTPHPQWAPADEEMLQRVKAYTARLDAERAAGLNQ